MRIFKNFKEGLTKNVIALGIVSGLTDISSEMLYPVIPIFLNQFLNANMSLIGLIEGIAESTANILKIFGGYLSDKIRKRKIIVVVGYSLSAIAKPIMGIAYTWHFVLFARFIDRVGKGIRTSPRDALIAGSSDKNHWGKAFGFHRTMDTIGAAIGPIVALVIFLIFGETEKTYRMIFIIAFIPAILGVYVLKRYVKDETEISIESRSINNDIKKEPFSLDFKIFTSIFLIFSIVKFSDAFLIMKAKSIGFSTSEIIMVYFAYNIFYAILSTPLGIISDKIGKIKVFMVSFLIYLVVCIGFAYSNSHYQIWIFFLVYSFYGAISEVIAKAIISNFTTSSNRAFGMGIFQGLSGICILFSSIIAGILWDRFSPSTPFIVSSIVSFISLILLYSWARIRKVKV